MEDSNETFEAPEGWTNPPKLEDLKNDLMGAKPSHDAEVTQIDAWLDNLNITGSAKMTAIEGRSSVQPKLIRKQAEWRYAALSEPFLNSDELFRTAPKTWEDADAAEQNRLILNKQINSDIDKVAFIDEYVRAIVDEGTVIVRVDWEFEEEEVTEQVPLVQFRVNPELIPLHEELAGMKQENPTGYKFEVPEELQMAHEASIDEGQPLEPIVLGYEDVTVTKTVVNRPSLEVCDYHNIIIDPNCKNKLDKADFIIYSFETSLSALRKAGKYTNLENINVSNASVLSEPDHATEDNSDFSTRDEPRKKFVAYEYWGYWDYLDTGIAEPFVATWVGSTLIRMDVNPYPDKKLPFVSVPFMPKKKKVRGEPDGELLIDNQKITGAVTRGMIDIMGRSANGQTGSRKDALDATNKRKFQKGLDYEYNGQVDPRLAFNMHTYPEIPNSAPLMLQMQNIEAESMTGVKAFSQGISGDSLGESVGNGRSVMDAASKRETGILRRLASGVVKIGRKIIAMNAEFLEEEEVVRITNREFVTIRRDDLAGNFDLNLSISTVEEDDSKAQELAFMLQTLGPNADPGMTNIILRDIARLRKMPELAHEIETFEPTPDPVQEEMQQLELQKLRLEAAEIESKIQANFAGAGLDQARAQEVIAKARLLGSQADKSDLDFVEQESGVTQERDLQKQGEQARGNMALELVKQSGAANKELERFKSAKKIRK